MTFFGRRGGPARLVLAIVAVGVLVLLSFIIFTLNGRLDNQERANQTSIQASDRIVQVNDKVTTRLAELTELTHTAQTALDSTSALQPLLVKLGQAISPVAELLSADTTGAQITNAQLTTIQGILGQVEDTVVPLVSSAAKFGEQGKQLLNVVQGLVADLRSSVDSARTINNVLPLPG